MNINTANNTNSPVEVEDSNLIVYAILSSKEDLTEAVNDLILNGFNKDYISVIYHSKSNEINKHDVPSQGVQGAIIGGGSGAILGGALGLITATALAIPGGSILIAGYALSLLGGATLGGSFGGVSGALIGLGYSQR